MTADVQAPPRLRRARAERAAAAVLPACGVAWTAAEILHACSVAPLDVGFGGAAAAALAGVTGHRATAGGLLLAGAWTAAAARFGPLAGPWCPLTDAWAVLSFCGWRWARSHPAVAAARDLRLAKEDWHGTRRRWRLDRTFLLEREETRLGERLLLDVSDSGKLASQIAASDVAGWIAQDRRIPRTRVKVAVHGHEGQVSVDIRERDPWKHAIPHPVLDDAPEIDLSGPCTCRDPFIVGQDPETGTPLALPVWDEDGGKRILIVATSRAGKTVLLSCLRERGTRARDVLIVDLNLSKALEDKEWAPACHLTALTRHQLNRAVKILRLVNAIIEWRSQQPRETAVFQPSPQHPLILLCGDEIDALARYPGAREALRDIFSKGGSEGVSVVIGGQRGTAEWIGGGDIRSLVDVYCVGMVSRRAEAMHAAGDLGLEMPDMSRYGEGRKGVWAVAELGGKVRTGRTFLLKEPADLRKLAEARADVQPELEPELQKFLGKPYEDLLRTDVYAVWARDRKGPRPVVAHPRPDIPPEPAPEDARPAPAPLAVLAGDPLTALDEELNAAVPGDLRNRWLKQGERLAEIRRDLEDARSQPVPDIPHDVLVAQAEARWRELGEATEIPEAARGPLLALLAAGTTISEAARVLEVSKWTARTYLERLRGEGRVRIEGERRTARWLLNDPGEGDGS